MRQRVLPFRSGRATTQVTGTASRTGNTSGNKARKAGGRIKGMTLRVVPALLLTFAGTQYAAAQKSVAAEALSRHGIDISVLDPKSFQQPDDYAFDLTQKTSTAGKETVIAARFDPSAPKEEQWSVSTVNGKAPTRSEVATFRKDQGKGAAGNAADDASYRFEKESAGKLVISYKADPASVPKDAAFMKDCRTYMTINTANKQVEQIQVINEKPLKIKILNADKFELVQHYIRNEQAGRYFPANQRLNIEAKFMGQDVNVQTITEYANYSKK